MKQKNNSLSSAKTVLQTGSTLLAIFIIQLLFHACHNQPKTAGERGTAEGTVTYTISYPAEVSSHQMSFIFPKEMTLSFKNDMQRLSFKGGMGLYNFDFIFNGSSDTVFTLLRVNLLDQKLYVPASSSQLFIFAETQGGSVVFDPSEHQNILGFDAQKAILQSNIKNVPDIVTWYTNQLGIKSPNRHTPFEQIPGVLLQSEIIYKNIHFQFKSEKIDTITAIDSTLFTVPADYRQTSIEEIEELINTVL